MDLSRTIVITVLAYAVYLAWSFTGGRKGRVPVYFMSSVVAVSLSGAAAGQFFGLAGAVESLNVTSISFSLAALVTDPSLWEQQLRTDWEGTRLYQSLRFRDFLSWRWWLKLVDRVGAKAASLGYFGIFLLGMLGQIVVWGLTRPEVDRFVLVALVAPLVFSLLSAIWIYQGVRKVMPGA